MPMTGGRTTYANQSAAIDASGPASPLIDSHGARFFAESAHQSDSNHYPERSCQGERDIGHVLLAHPS